MTTCRDASDLIGVQWAGGLKWERIGYDDGERRRYQAEILRLDTDSPHSLAEFLDEVHGAVSRLPTELQVTAVVSIERDSYDEYARPEFSIHVYRDEPEEEFLARKLKQKEANKISAERRKAAKERAEREAYERLKAKFG